MALSENHTTSNKKKKQHILRITLKGSWKQCVPLPTVRFPGDSAHIITNQTIANSNNEKIDLKTDPYHLGSSKI